MISNVNILNKEHEYCPLNVKNIIQSISLPLVEGWISEDFDDFYSAYKSYMNNNGDLFSRADFERKGWDLFLSIKHREVEGFLSPAQADELREYMRDLLDD